MDYLKSHFLQGQNILPMLNMPIWNFTLSGFNTTAREITHATAQSIHEHVWHVKWNQEGRLRRSNSHPSDRESCLTSGLPTCWHACKLLHCVIDPDVVFWYDYLSPAWMHQGREGVLSLGDARQDMSLNVGLLEKIVAGKKEFIGRSWENCYF